MQFGILSVATLGTMWVPCGVPRYCFSVKDNKVTISVVFHDKYFQLPIEWMLKSSLAVNSIIQKFCAIFSYKVDENQLFQNCFKIIFLMICSEQNLCND